MAESSLMSCTLEFITVAYISTCISQPFHHNLTGSHVISHMAESNLMNITLELIFTLISYIITYTTPS